MDAQSNLLSQVILKKGNIIKMHWRWIWAVLGLWAMFLSLSNVLKYAYNWLKLKAKKAKISKSVIMYFVYHKAFVRSFRSAFECKLKHQHFKRYVKFHVYNIHIWHFFYLKLFHMNKSFYRCIWIYFRQRISI